MTALNSTTQVWASSPNALNLIDRALVGIKALEHGGSPVEAIREIPGASATAANDGAAYELGNIPSSAVNTGPVDVAYDSSSTKLTLAEGDGITVRGMLNTALNSGGIAVNYRTPTHGMKR